MHASIAVLKQHHANADREAFFRQMMDIAPGLEIYVANRLRTAERNGLIPYGLYDPQDILDEVLLGAYEHFDEMPEDESGLRVKLFQLANEKLDEIIGQMGLNAELLRGEQMTLRLLARIYADLPAQSRIIFDLWTRGRLTVEEIARVRGLDVTAVKDILEQIKVRFSSVIK